MLGRYKDYSTKDLKKLLVRKLKRPFYSGTAYQCPVCQSRLKKFNPIWKSFVRSLQEAGFIYPLDSFETFNLAAYACPSCDASDRERLYALYIRQWLAKLAPDRSYRFIDFAPAMAISSWLRGVANISYRSIDLYRKNADEKADITRMPQYPDNSVDAFICSHILEHVEDDKTAIRELFRILKPADGLAFGIVMVPLIHNVMTTQEDPAVNTEALRTKHYAQNDHLRLYGKRDFVGALEAAGFIVEQLGSAYFGQEIFRKAGIADNSVLYVVKKPAHLTA